MNALILNIVYAKKKKDQIDIGSKVVGHISELVIKFKLYSKVEALCIA